MQVHLFQVVDRARRDEQLRGALAAPDLREELPGLLAFTGADERLGARLDALGQQREVELGLLGHRDELLVEGERDGALRVAAGRQLQQRLGEGVEARGSLRQREDAAHRVVARGDDGALELAGRRLLLAALVLLGAPA